MTAHTAITAQDVCDRRDSEAVYAAQLERTRRNLELDECRAIVGGKPIVSPFYHYSPEAMTEALFAMAGGLVTKVGL